MVRRQLPAAGRIRLTVEHPPTQPGHGLKCHPFRQGRTARRRLRQPQLVVHEPRQLQRQRIVQPRPHIVQALRGRQRDIELHCQLDMQCRPALRLGQQIIVLPQAHPRLAHRQLVRQHQVEGFFSKGQPPGRIVDAQARAIDGRPRPALPDRMPLAGRPLPRSHLVVAPA